MALVLLLLGLLMKFSVFTDAQVGVCYGKNGDNLPSAEDVVKLYQDNGITRMRIYAPNADTLEALKGKNIELILDAAHESIENLSTDQGFADTWVRENVLNYYPDVKFRYIAVGNEVDPEKPETSWLVDFVLPAMEKIHNALRDAGLHNQIKVSTATYTGLLDITYPPSAGVFKSSTTQGSNFIGQIITFLKDNGSPMLANIYPYFPHVKDPINNNLEFASFTRTTPAYADENNGLPYINLFDAMYDAHYAAQSRLGGVDIEIVVSESGWPSAGGVAATPENAGTYYKNLISHVKSPVGTPVRPGKPIETYLFAMFDENEKKVEPEETTERNFGVFDPVTRGAKYQLNF